MRIDEAIKKLEDKEISKEEKLQILEELELEIYEFELPRGRFYHHKDTAPYNCYKFYYNFHLQKLTNQTPQRHPS